MRFDGRTADQLRPVTIVPRYLPRADGSALIECGATKVLCTASLENRQPPFLTGTAKGWVSAEYSLLPGSTTPRSPREVNRGSVTGRTAEIQRLIGRSLRMAVDTTALGPRTIWIDCDVLQADGGTRTAAITGAWVALALAVDKVAALHPELRAADILRRQVAAVSAGVIDDEILLDLAYPEDSRATIDMNLVMDGQGNFIEVQATAEKAPLDPGGFDRLLDIGRAGVAQLLQLQRRTLQSATTA